MEVTTKNLAPYLENSDLYNFRLKEIAAVCKQIESKSNNQLTLIQNIYDYVNNDIKHTADTDEQTVTCSASQVLSLKHGICCAKANLFASLLRYFAIPVGFCYQKLRSSDHTEFVLHGLNAVYFENWGKWLRLDVGGVKSESCARFSLDKEIVAYKVDTNKGEQDHRSIFPQPNSTVINVLQKSENRTELWKNWAMTLQAVFKDGSQNSNEPSANSVFYLT